MDHKNALDFEGAKRLLLEAIAERGRDYVDPNSSTVGGGGSCKYLKPDGETPDCGVGCVLFAHGLTAADLAVLDAANGYVGTPASTINKFFPGTLTPKAKYFLQAFQACQDTGGTWGDAYDEAILMRYYEQYGGDDD